MSEPCSINQEHPELMKKLFFVLSLGICTMPVFAQSHNESLQTEPFGESRGRALKSPEIRAERMTRKMQQELSLTDDQYSKVLAVNTECVRRKDAMSAGSNGHGDASFKEIGAYRRQQFASILSLEQMSMLKQMRQKRGAAKQGSDLMQDDRGRDMSSPANGN